MDRPEKLLVKLQSTRFEKLIFSHVFNVRKTKRIIRYKGIVALEIEPKSSVGTFEKEAAEHRIVMLFRNIVAGIEIHLLQTAASTHRVKY